VFSNSACSKNGVKLVSNDSNNMATLWRPQHEIQFVAGTPPGGGQDRPARALIEVLAAMKLVGQPVKLLNIAGRGGANAWDYLMKHRGDPHVLAITSPTIISNQLLGVSEVSYNDLTPLANLYTEYAAFIVRSDSTIMNAHDLLQRLKADASSVQIALATAIGNTNHIALAQVTKHSGGDVRALPISIFDSARDAVAHVVAGKSELGVITAASAVPEMTAGLLRTVAVSAPARLGGLFHDCPTWVESGVESSVGMWRGVIAPPDIPVSAVGFWHQTLAAAVEATAWKDTLKQQFWVSAFFAPDTVREFLGHEHDHMVDVLGELGLLKARQS
jgi:putative tricarboxylic transport membrane protein